MEIIFFLALVLVVGLFLFWWLENRRARRISPRKERVRKAWQKVEELARKDLEKAILAGDKLLDSLLKEMKIKGATTNERLKRAQKLFSNFRAVKGAHILRNKIVHEADFALKEKEGRKALRGFEKAIKELLR